MTEVIKKVGVVATELSKLGEEGYKVSDLARIWAQIPVDDWNDLNYLELADNCILSVSDLVDQQFPKLSHIQRMHKKLKLMAKLLSLKADQIA